MGGTDVRPYLQQLDPDELNFLAKYITAKVAKGSNKKKLVDILYSHHMKKQDVVKFLSKPNGRTGIYAKYDGESYEKKVFQYMKNLGWDCELNKRTRATEFDIIGTKGTRLGGFFSRKKWIVIECKNQAIVTNQDLQKFAGKFKGFKDEHEDRTDAEFTYYGGDERMFTGLMVTTGIFDPLAIEAVKKHKDIELKRMRF